MGRGKTLPRRQPIRSAMPYSCTHLALRTAVPPDAAAACKRTSAPPQATTTPTTTTETGKRDRRHRSRERVRTGGVFDKRCAHPGLASLRKAWRHNKRRAQRRPHGGVLAARRSCNAAGQLCIGRLAQLSRSWCASHATTALHTRRLQGPVSLSKGKCRRCCGVAGAPRPALRPPPRPAPLTCWSRPH